MKINFMTTISFHSRQYQPNLYHKRQANNSRIYLTLKLKKQLDILLVH
jgi:hypothetical protein